MSHCATCCFIVQYHMVILFVNRISIFVMAWRRYFTWRRVIAMMLSISVANEIKLSRTSPTCHIPEGDRAVS